jgi:thioredoxin reductase (NADPH)
MLDVIVIGAGPCGLACAIEAGRKQLNYLVLDKGNVAEAVRRYPVQMNFFSTSENIEIGGVPLISHDIRPTRFEALKYYQRVAQEFRLNIKRFTEVEWVEKTERGFRVHSSQGMLESRFVIIATGYYDLPKYINVPGEDLPHVSHYYDEPFKYSGTNCVVVGGANSAIETALDLYRHGANITLIHQFEELDQNVKYWVRPDAVNRIKEGSITAHFSSKVKRISPDHVYAENDQGKELQIEADYVFLMTGYRPDANFLQKSGIKLGGEALIPQINSETYESNIEGMFLAGSIIGGEETAKVFIENGRLHGKVIIELLTTRL